MAEQTHAVLELGRPDVILSVVLYRLPVLQLVETGTEGRWMDGRQGYEGGWQWEWATTAPRELTCSQNNSCPIVYRIPTRDFSDRCDGEA